MSRSIRIGITLLSVTLAHAPVFAQPQTIGQWEGEMNWDLRGMHMIVLRNGTVLCLSDPRYPEDCDPYPCPENNNVGIFDPATNTINISVPQMPRIFENGRWTQWDLHCSGHSQLPSGKVLICAGGSDPATPTTAAETLFMTPRSHTNPGRIDR